MVKNPPVNAGDAGDMGWIPGPGRSPEGGPGNPLKYFCLENPMDRGVWQATVHGVAKSQTQLKRFCIHAAAKLLQSCPTLCNPMDGSPPGSPIPGILQARTLEWVTIFFSIKQNPQEEAGVRSGHCAPWN